MIAINDISAALDEAGKALATYREHGVVLVRGVLSPDHIAAFTSAVALLIRYRLEQEDRGTHGVAETIDDLFRDLVAIDGKGGGELLLAARDTPAFFDIVLAPNLRRLVSTISEQKLLQFVPEMCQLRIDGPEQQDRLFAWHYDAAYTGMADSAVTCWLPMTPISRDMGPLKIIPGSHREIWKVRFRHDLLGQAFAGPRRVEIANPDLEHFERRAIEAAPMEPGDALIFHSRLLHSSGDNKSARYRWICNPRYGDLADARLVRNGWHVSSARNPFAFGDYYPEQVVSDA
jgi:ectoine hydroxylase-related dioxygenase (phytanoyl-CoA dioxygenase family)